MPCDNYLELISARLDGELTAREEADLTAHLDTCPACRAAADQLSSLHSALGELEVPAPAQLNASVLRSIQTERRAARRRALRRWGSLAACLALCLGLYALTGMPGQDQPDTNTPVTARTIGPDACAAAPDDAPIPFSDQQAFPVTWGSMPDHPSAVVLGSTDSLAAFVAQFPDDDLSALTDTYDAAFFRENRLLAVLVYAHFAPTTFTLAPESLTRNGITVIRNVFPTTTEGKVAWLLTARVDTSFQDGDTLSVLFN